MTCKGCTKRKVGCHSTCEEYIEECRQRNIIKEKVAKEKQREREITTVEVERRKKYGRNR